MTGLARISQEELAELCDYLYRETGLVYAENKRYYIERRLTDRMLATNMTSFAGYFEFLRGHASAELAPFINAFTVNETYFYREDYQLRCLTAELLPRRIGREKIRILSLPCATGEEPYSIAMWLLENWAAVDSYDVEIVGADIDTQVLDAARAGIYGKRALMRLSDELVAKYFIQLDAERWQIIGDLRGSVLLAPVNAVEAAQTRRLGKFDVIFCRNMLIYFDETSRRIAAENLFESLLPGGYLCLGHAESMSRISALFEICRYDDAIVYRRPHEGSRD
jgi:chemotaxis protein methyltransferase CheR